MITTVHKCDSCHAAVLSHEEQMLETYTLCPECYAMVTQAQCEEQRNPYLMAASVTIVVIVLALIVITATR